MRCEKCGEDLPINATYCGKCGATAPSDSAERSMMGQDFELLKENIRDLLIERTNELVSSGVMPPRTRQNWLGYVNDKTNQANSSSDLINFLNELIDKQSSYASAINNVEQMLNDYEQKLSGGADGQIEGGELQQKLSITGTKGSVALQQDSRQHEPAIQKWEYAYIRVLMMLDDLIVVRINSLVQDFVRRPARVYDVLNQMGDEGWELISVEATFPPSPKAMMPRGAWDYVLKRPKRGYSR